ncbi:hypothetical protein F511_11888 [Dorcoceras hygrometricum]|uniref:Uncharacterized protein n=1 Tax=Dorcoceras hygrometricum TaxID=472368 RepID=A0A2Z7D5D5_9LAMI|nr:hypothetical protein F511_11888 [Dorcoceras hygrometricum]
MLTSWLLILDSFNSNADIILAEYCCMLLLTMLIVMTSSLLNTSTAESILSSFSLRDTTNSSSLLIVMTSLLTSSSLIQPLALLSTTDVIVANPSTDSADILLALQLVLAPHNWFQTSTVHLLLRTFLQPLANITAAGLNWPSPDYEQLLNFGRLHC